jgi:hypothetical protein
MPFLGCKVETIKTGINNTFFHFFKLGLDIYTSPEISPLASPEVF